MLLISVMDMSGEQKLLEAEHYSATNRHVAILAMCKKNDVIVNSSIKPTV